MHFLLFVAHFTIKRALFKKTKGTNVFHKYAMHFALPERLT